MPYGFSIAEGTARTFWVAGDSASTYYQGQLVAWNASAGAANIGTVTPLPAASGIIDATGEVVIAGIVVGFDWKTPEIDSTYKIPKLTGACTTQAHVAARTAAGVYNQGRGMYNVGDHQPLLEIAPVGPDTLIKGYIMETAGTAPTVVTSTAADTTGGTTALTTNACAFTPVANTCSIYCRKGTNMGIWRTTNDTSTTAPDVTIAFPNDIAIGDQFVRLSIKQGFSHIQMAANPLSTFIDNTLSGGTTNSYGVYVYYIDAREAGKEYAIFKFDGIHFCSVRA